MRKLTKGFLIFGVVSTILGFIMIIVGAQSNGIQSLLAMSKDPVYDNRIEEVTFGNEVEKLDPYHLSSFGVWSSRFDYWYE